MNKALKSVYFLALLFVVGFGAACKAPPVEDMDKAVEAVTRAANDADAVNYAGDTLNRAKDTLSRMRSEADTKRYDSAKSLAAEAVTLAEKAIADGKAGAARAKDEASRLLSAIKPEITQTGDELEAAKKVTNLNLDTGALDGELASAAAAYSDAEKSLNASSYRDAVTKAQPIRPALANIRGRISDAVIAASRKK